MNVSTQQYVGSAVFAAAVLLLGATVFLAGREVDRAVKKNEAADKIVLGVSQLRFVSFEYLRHRHERAETQWWSRHQSLAEILSGGDFGDPEDQSAISLLQLRHEDLKTLFSSLADRYDAQSAANDSRHEMESRVVSQFLESSQDMVVDAFRLARASRAKLLSALSTALWFMIALIAILAAVVAVNSVLMFRRILTPISRLREGTAIVAAGNLEHRIGIVAADEMGQLSTSFDRMTAELKASRAAIEAELAERRRAEEDLKRSNAELEQFAYVASHDLQEPLRMVVSYLQLIERRYKGKLDANADEFIGFAVDGARRMGQLINDILDFSRVGTRGKPFAPVDCTSVIAVVRNDLRAAIEESGAEIACDSLPTVYADPTQLPQVFQNLIGNAIKFRSGRAPRIWVGAKKDMTEWTFAVKDNGIGIAPEHLGRIFGIFQRLHTRSEYAGTGIGLAICKKIVERHGGRIWAESEPGTGSAFYFTLPAQGDASS